MNRRRILVVAAAGLCAALWTYACGDGATEPPPPAPDPPRPTTIAVAPATVRLTALGATEQLTAEVRDQNGNAMAGAAVSWASSAASVATVSSTGLVTAVGNGTATITATAGSASGSATVTVAQEVSAVAISPAADTLVAGDTLRLAAEATDANGRPVAGPAFDWTSSDTLVAVVDDLGLVTGVGAGEAEVTATAAGVTGRAELTVVTPVPTTVAVSPDTVALTALGQTAQLDVEVRDQIGRVMEGVPVSWSSADTTVAAVDSTGLVTAAGNGTATITATAGSASGSATVTVAQEVSAVAVSPATDTLVAGDTLGLAAEATDANGRPVAGTEFDWASSDTLVAVVDDVGLVTGVGAGEAEVTATAAGVTGRAALTVAAPAPTAVAVTPDTVALTALGQTAQLAAEVHDQIGRVMEGFPMSWSSADTLVAKVDSAGLVTAIGGGATTVAATAGAISGTAVVTVMQSAGSVVVSPAGDTVAPGDTLRLAAEAFDENGHRVDGAEFTWSSSDVSVATVDGTGLVAGVAEGRATITAAAGDASGASEITVENPDRAALVALYNATDGPNWVNNENWLTDAPLGRWYGVRDAEGLVSRLSLSANSLAGPIPPELGNLANLTSLRLADNKLTGSIPPELGNLANLTVLHLYRNNLTGPIPPELGKLANLMMLELRANSLTGPIPPELANLPNLKRLVVPAGVCVPADLRAWAVELGVSVFPCSSEGRLLPSALMREDGNGLSLALPDDLREPSAVTVDDPSVVAVSVADGWLELVPRGRGSAEVEVVPSGGGAPASARVVVRAAVGTFGIDIVMDQPAPVSYEKALTTSADWWSSVLDGTEWPDRRPTCFNDRATALADELLIHASIDLDTQVSGYASTCFRSSGEQAALDPGGGRVTSAPHSSTLPLVRHEIAHLLGLVLWQPETGLVTGDGAYFVGPRAVKAFRESGGDPGLPGVPLSPDRAHWAVGVKDFMASFRPEGAISVAALADAGYTVDMTKANTSLGPYNAQAVVDHAGDVVPAETRRLPSDGSGGGGPPR